MLKKIFLLCFLLSVFLFAQQYTNEKYEKYVGTKLGKYPLTVTGLKRAIAALDSGVIYISYPGLWDTTGLGQIPNKISLHGYLFGKHTIRANQIFSVVIPDSVLMSDWQTGAFNSYTKNANSFGFRQQSYYTKPWTKGHGNLFISQIDSNRFSGYNGDFIANRFDATLADIDTTFSSNFSSIAVQANNSTYRVNGHAIPNLVGFDAAWMFNSPGKVDTVINYYGYRSRYTPWYTAVINNAYAFYSNSASYPAETNFYHFYGNGNKPSYFGGNLQADGTSIKFENLPSDSTSLTTGHLYYDSSGFVKRKF